MFALAAIILTVTLVIPVQAAPTVRPFAGKTSVLLSEDLVAALGTLSIELGIIHPAFARRSKVSFPIPGGGIDLETLKGEILHLGGLSLTDENETKVELLDFVIDTTGLPNTPVLTGLVIVDGDLLARIPLFNLELTTAPLVKSGKLIIRNVNLTLTAEAATALNEVFGVTAFEEDFPVGEAKVKALFSDDDDDNDRDDDDDDNDRDDDDD
jgi:hypothetical protein